MAITTRGCKQTIDPPMPTNEKKVTKDTDNVVDIIVEVEITPQKMLKCLKR